MLIILRNKKLSKLHHFGVKNLPYSTLRALVKVCGKPVSRKLLLRDAAQLKARYLRKSNESQLAWGSRVNLQIHKNAISISLKREKRTVNIQNNHYFLRCMVIGELFLNDDP